MYLHFHRSTDSLEYNKTSYMIPMRDGILLNTVVLTPVDQNASYPFLIVRTPYGIDEHFPNGNQGVKLSRNFQFFDMAADGYIFVFQDIRGKYKSQGYMEIHQPLCIKQKKVQWMRARIPGIRLNGFYTTLKIIMVKLVLPEFLIRAGLRS